MIKRSIILLIFVVLFIDFTSAQSSLWRRKRKQIFFGAGATNFLGDLGGANQIGTNGIRDFDVESIRPDFIIGYRYRATKQSSIRANVIYAYVGGNDKYTLEPFRNNRNCNFRSPIIEVSCQFEFQVTRERPYHIYNLQGVRGWRYIQITTYFFGGIGGIYMNPKAKVDNKWFALRPLSTEGQGLVPTRRKYSRFQVVIPFGVGFVYALNKDWSVGIEYGIRKTFTDYMDDVSKTYFDPEALRNAKGDIAAYLSNPTNYNLGPGPTAPGSQRGDPRDKDSYMFAFISFYYKIPNNAFTLPKFR